MVNNVKLSPNFWLSELVKSSTAERLSIDNWPKNPREVDNLQKIAVNILQPVREHYDIPFSPSSGFRCLKLNRALKSKDSSQHVKGQAVDFEVPGVPNKELAEWIRDNLNFDQLILEFWYEGSPNSGWVHCSYVSVDKNRNQCLTINKNGVFNGVESS